MKTNTIPSAEFSALISRLGIRQGPHPTPTDGEWNLDTLSGRLAELSSDGHSACVSSAVSLILHAQHRGEPAAWIGVGESTFFPPDAAQSGVDLDALPVVLVKDTRAAARTADKLLRSGAFAVIVLDLGRNSEISVPVQSRLVGLAKKHHTALLCLTKKRSEAPSIGSLVSIRGETRVKKTGFDRFTWEIRVTKDKRHGPGWSHTATCRGPDGLC
jgi:recombination protein RecA